MAAQLGRAEKPLPSLDRAHSALQAFVEHVASSQLQPGARLPTERVLAETLSVGRSTIREAIGKLQALGIVETRQGSGTYLLRTVSANTIHIPLTINASRLRDRLLQTLDVRRGLEVEASALAALRRSPDDLATLEEKLVEMERVHRIKGMAGREDFAFHLAIYDCAHNPLFHQLLAQIWEPIKRFWHEPFDRPDFAHRSFPFHRELFNAIRDGEAAMARAKTLAILAIVEEDIKDMSK